MRHLLRVTSIRLGLAALALAALQLTGCSSSEQRAQAFYEHGKQLLAAHDYQRAEVELRNAVSYNKKLLPAWQALAQVEEHQHNWKGMVPALHEIVELDPNDMAARVKLGRLLLLGGAFKDALQLVNDVKGPDGQNADLLALKAAILFKLNDADGAVRTAQAALKIDPANAGAMFVLAGNDFAHGDAKAALDILNNKDLATKSDLGIELFKLQIFEKTQDLPQAEALLQKLIELYPKEANFKKELTRLYLFQHRNDDAEKEQRLIVAADPTNTQAQLDLVQLLITTKGADAAQQQLATLIKAGGDVFPYQVASARLSFAQGKFSDAEAVLKKLISDASSPGHVLTAQTNLAEMYLSQKQADAASALVADILNKDARNINGLKLRATIELDNGKLEAAVNDLRQALNDQPRATDLMLMLATAYERSGSIDLAAKEFADAMQVSNFNPTISLDYVTFLQRRGRASDAEDVLTDLASRWPQNVAVLSAFAQLKLARQDYVSAQQIAETIKRISANHTMADELLGAALAGRNKYDESIATLQDAYETAPNATQPMYALVRAYLRAQHPEQAIAFLQSVIKANATNAEAYVLLGSVQLTQKLPDQARQSFMTAIAKQPAKDIGYRALADFYILQKNNDEALKTVQAGLKEQPDSLVLHLSLADLLERSGNFEGAISEYQSLLTKEPDSMVVANNLASLLADHRTDKASLDRAQALAQSLQRSPLPQLKDTLGWVDYREGDYKAAMPLLEGAAAALPNLALVHYHLGMNYLAVSQPDKANEQFKLALAQGPDQDLENRIHLAQTKGGGTQ